MLKIHYFLPTTKVIKMIKVYVKNYNNIWYLCTPYGLFEFDNEHEPNRLLMIIKAYYEQGKRDKINEIREALYLEDVE